MNWFFLALVAPILWAIVNISDKYLVNNYSPKGTERGSGSLVLFSSLIGILIAFLIWVFSANVFFLPAFDKLILMITGILTILWVILYLFTLETEDISTVAPYFLTVPIFGYVLGYIFFKETLSFQQIIGALTILVGLFIISSDFSKENKKFKWKPTIYMLIACFLVSISGVLFKYVTVQDNFWVASFWGYVGLGISGIFIFLFIPQYRNQFIQMNKKGGKKIFLVNVASELLTIAGNLLTNFALLLAPVTMVYLVSSFQPGVVLFFGILCTRFFPNIIKENLDKHILFPKITAIGIMIIGSIILFM